MNENDYILLVKDKIFIIKIKLIKKNIYRLMSYDDKKILIILHEKLKRFINLKEIISLQQLWYKRFKHASYTKIKLIFIMINDLFLNELYNSYEADILKNLIR